MVQTHRTKIEHTFGHVQNMFNFMHHTFAGRVERFDELVHCAVALYQRNSDIIEHRHWQQQNQQQNQQH